MKYPTGLNSDGTGIQKLAYHPKQAFTETHTYTTLYKELASFHYLLL